MLGGVVTKLQHQNAAGFEQYCRLRDERRVDFRPGFAAEKRDGGLMLADFALAALPLRGGRCTAGC